MKDWEKTWIKLNWERLIGAITFSPILSDLLEYEEKSITPEENDESERIGNSVSYGNYVQKQKLLRWLMGRENGYNSLLQVLTKLGRTEATGILNEGIQHHRKDCLLNPESLYWENPPRKNFSTEIPTLDNFVRKNDQQNIIVILSENLEITVDRIKDTFSIPDVDYSDFEDNWRDDHYQFNEKTRVFVIKGSLPNRQQLSDLQKKLAKIVIITENISDQDRDLLLSLKVILLVDTLEWANLSVNFKKELLTNECVYFQKNKESLITLSLAFGTDKIEACLEGQFLINVMSKGVTPTLAVNPVPENHKNYLDRVLRSSCNISRDKILNDESNDVFTFSGCGRDVLWRKFLNRTRKTGTAREVTKHGKLTLCHYCLDENAEMDYNIICGKATNTGKSVHWFHYNVHTEKINWVKSSGCMTSVQKMLNPEEIIYCGESKACAAEDFKVLDIRGLRFELSNQKICVSESRENALLEIGKELLKTCSETLVVFMELAKLVDLFHIFLKDECLKKELEALMCSMVGDAQTHQNDLESPIQRKTCKVNVVLQDPHGFLSGGCQPRSASSDHSDSTNERNISCNVKHIFLEFVKSPITSHQTDFPLSRSPFEEIEKFKTKDVAKLVKSNSIPDKVLPVQNEIPESKFISDILGYKEPDSGPKNTKRKKMENLDPATNHSVIIAATPGMGKSDLLASIGNQLLNVSGTNKIVLYMQFSKFIDSISDEIRKHQQANVQLDTILLNLISSSVATTQLATALIKSSILDGRVKVELLLDEYEKVDRLHVNLCKKVFHILNQHKGIRIIATTQPHFRNELENILKVLSYTIVPLSDIDQNKYFLSAWKDAFSLREETWDDLELQIIISNLKSFTTKFLKYIEDNPLAGTRPITSIPRQASQLAEFFEQDAFSFSSLSCKANSQPVFALSKSPTEMYIHMIKKNFENSMHPEKDKNYEHWHRVHGELAFVKVFSDASLCNLIPKPCPTILNDVLHIGIVEKTNDGVENTHFIHPSFVEYFVAVICSPLIYHQHFQAFFFDQILYTESHREGVFLSRKFLRLKILQHLNYLLSDKIIIENCVKIKTLENLSSEFCEELVQTIVKYDLCNIFDLLVHSGIFKGKESVIFSEKVLLIAALHSSRDLLDSLVAEFLKIYPGRELSKIKFSRGQETLLHAAVSRGSFSIMEALLDNDSIYLELTNNTLQSYGSLLHACVGQSRNDPEEVISEKKDIVQSLLQISSEGKEELLENTGDGDCTPIFCQNVHIQLLLLLIDEGADIQCKKGKWCTVAHWAVQYLNADEFETLLLKLKPRLDEQQISCEDINSLVSDSIGKFELTKNSIKMLMELSPDLNAMHVFR